MRNTAQLMIAALFLGSVACGPFRESETTDSGSDDYVAPTAGDAGTPEQRLLVIARDMPLMERVATIEGALAWERAAAASCPVAFSIEIGDVSDAGMGPGMITAVVGPVPDGYEGWASSGPLGARITLKPGLDKHHAAVVARHELGHALGLFHEDVEPDAGIMGEARSITRADVVALCKRLAPPVMCEPHSEPAKEPATLRQRATF